MINHQDHKKLDQRREFTISTLIKPEFLLSKHSKALFYRFRVCKDHI